MTLTQLRYLTAIADSGLNITLAAERVHATQPGLSKQLKLLEDELGFQLFARKGRSLQAISPAGERVLAHARRMLGEAANIRTYAANERGEHAGWAGAGLHGPGRVADVVDARLEEVGVVGRRLARARRRCGRVARNGPLIFA